MTKQDLQLLRFPAKEIRSHVIKTFMQQAGYKRAVCFSCGNASRQLKEAGVDVIDISPTGDLIANKWWTPAEIKNVFKDEFDATSGHLPMYLMVSIAREFKNYLGNLDKNLYAVPTGSGETIMCLKIAYPHINFIAVYDMDSATEYSPEAPLNEAVRAFFATISHKVHEVKINFITALRKF